MGKSVPESGRAILYFLIGLMITGWSGNYVAGKIALRTFPPVVLFTLRMPMAGTLMLLVYWWKRRQGAPPSWTLRDVPQLIRLGVFGVALNQCLFIFGLSRTSVAHSSIFGNTTPILVLLLASMRGMERLTSWKIAGVMTAMIGVVLLRLLDSSGGPEATLAGDLLIFCGAMAFSIFTVFGKPDARRFGPVTLNTFAYVGAALLVSPVTLWEAAHYPYRAVPLSAWAAAFYMSAIPSVTCYLIYYYALARMDASRLAAFAYLQPLLAIVFGSLLLHERVTPWLVVCGVIVFTGVYITERAR